MLSHTGKRTLEWRGEREREEEGREEEGCGSADGAVLIISLVSNFAVCDSLDFLFGIRAVGICARLLTHIVHTALHVGGEKKGTTNPR